MLSGLGAQARNARDPLICGYSILVSGWLLLARFAPGSRTIDGEPMTAFAEVWRFAGPTGRLAIVTAIALAVGGFTWRLVVARLVRRIVSAGADWDRLIELARTSVVYYEEHPSGMFGINAREQGQRWSTYHSSILQERVAERVARRSSAELRATVALALVPVSATATAVGGRLWAVPSLGVVTLVSLDFLLMQSATRHALRRFESDDHATRLRDCEKQREALRQQIAQNHAVTNFEKQDAALSAQIEDHQSAIETLRRVDRKNRWWTWYSDDLTNVPSEWRVP